MIVKSLSRTANRVRVTFALPCSVWAKQIAVVGDFNQWDPAATPMAYDSRQATWQVTLELEPGHCYRFRYLLDGREWLNDWYADGRLENESGSCDSVVDLGG